jgi:4-amino-4-deoxy-L-arabinose transferase-like glycosyltransferase
MDADRRDQSMSYVAAAILLAAAGIFFLRLGESGVVSEELRWAQIAREMRASGDYFHPTINGQPYFDKPLGSYWLIVLASYLTGGVDETAARLPAAVAGLIGVALTMSLGRRLVDTRTGLLAGAIAATSFGFVFYARRASADAETVAGVLAAVWLYERRTRPGPWIVSLWTIMAATSLTKGLLGFALPTVVFAVHSAWTGFERRGWRGLVAGQTWLLNGWSLIAIPWAIGLFLTPFVISIDRSGSTAGLDLLMRENIRRFFTPHNHTGPAWLYIGATAAILAPWSVFLPSALAPSRRGRPSDRLMLAYFWAIFAFFTLSASRRNYYILPIVPAAAILIARALVDIDPLPLRRRLRTLGTWIFAVCVFGAGTLALSPADVLPPPWDRLPPLPGRELFLFAWTVGAGWLVWSVLRRRFIRPTIAVAFAGIAFVFLVAMPNYQSLRTRPAFAAQIRDTVGDDPLALFHARDAVFDLNIPQPIPEYRDAERLTNDLRTESVKWIIARRRYLRNVDLPAEIVLEEPSHPWERDDQTGDKLMLLRVIPR